ncbi:hypothetical protein GCM10026982_36310 [Nocardiopsis aegyptia]
MSFMCSVRGWFDGLVRAFTDSVLQAALSRSPARSPGVRLPVTETASSVALPDVTWSRSPGTDPATPDTPGFPWNELTAHLAVKCPGPFERAAVPTEHRGRAGWCPGWGDVSAAPPTGGQRRGRPWPASKSREEGA